MADERALVASGIHSCRRAAEGARWLEEEQRIRTGGAQQKDDDRLDTSRTGTATCSRFLTQTIR